MKLLPIFETLEENNTFANHPDCKETLIMTIGYYKIVGFQMPWIGYYAKINDNIVGSGAYKGPPVDGKVEIAYSTFKPFRQKGVGAEICRQLVRLAYETDPSVVITARTLPEKNYSTRILEKNGFKLLGMVIDKDDGEVWEWRYINRTFVK